MSAPKPHPEALRHVAASRLQTDGAPEPGTAEEVGVVVEAPLSIDVDGFDVYTLLCTPTDTEALVVGFLFTEGIIDDFDAIAVMRPCADDPTLIRVQLREENRNIGEQGRNLLIASSCGLCGVESISKKLATLPRVGDHLRVESRRLRAMGAAVRQEQVLFDASGGSHAAGIFDAGGKLLAWAEDAGRHNALDKAIGKCMRAGLAMAGSAVALSGRASLDMVGKCARAGIELMSAVSAPTSLAIEVAEHCNITLCGFVRETRATVFTHPRRITGSAPKP